MQGKKVCKLRPTFEIFDPELSAEDKANWYNLTLPAVADVSSAKNQDNAAESYYTVQDNSDNSDTDFNGRPLTPRMRRRLQRRQRRRRNAQ